MAAEHIAAVTGAGGAGLLSLLPHRPPFLLLDTLDSAAPDAAQATLIVRPENPFVGEDGCLEPVAFAEILAQCFGAAAGALNAGQPPRMGYLAALRDMRILGTARTGDRLTARVRVSAVLGGIHVLEGDVLRDEDILAQGQIKIYVAEASL